jgi:PAT family beta-lactamase induction signal transducer AmpG
LSTENTAPDTRRLTRRLAVMPFLGFASGLPLALTGSSLQSWLTVAGVNVQDIGLFNLVRWPYVLKFLWAPLLDRFALPFLGRRRGWIVAMQVLLMAAIAWMAWQSPSRHLVVIGVLAMLVAFLSASQDIAIDAFRTDVLTPKERGPGAALAVSGYRVAMLASGGAALILADRFGWHWTYMLVAGLMLVGLVATLAAPEPAQPTSVPRSLEAAIVEPFRALLARDRALWFLSLVVLYKLGDAFAGALTTTFLIKALGFTQTEVGVINKGLGFAAAIGGTLTGGALIVRMGLYRSLLWFGGLQALTNLGFYALALAGKNDAGMAAVIVLENLAGGMGTSALVTLLMSLCDHRYTAAQYALLSALAAVAGIILGATAGYVVEATGWAHYFLITFVAGLPALVLLVKLRREIGTLEQSDN